MPWRGLTARFFDVGREDYINIGFGIAKNRDRAARPCCSLVRVQQARMKPHAPQRKKDNNADRSDDASDEPPTSHTSVARIRAVVIFGIKSSRCHRHQIIPNCDLVHTRLPPSGTDHTGRGGASYDRTSEAHARVVNNRSACDRHIASDYLDLGLGWSLATNGSRSSDDTGIFVDHSAVNQLNPCVQNVLNAPHKIKSIRVFVITHLPE